MINTVILDIGNVLARFGWKEYLLKCGYHEETIRKIGRATVQSKIWKEWDRGVMENTEMIELCCRQDPSVEKEIRKYFDDIYTIIEEYDYSAEFVRKLKAGGYKVYLLSNYNGQQFLHDRKRFEFYKYIDGAVISYEVSHIKPEPEIYKAIIQKYDINPSEAVFLDDVQENLDGAKPFGFAVIQVKSYEYAIGKLRGLGVRI